MATDTPTADQLAPRDLDQLRRACGEVITAGDASYDDARRLWNAIHDRRPAVIVRPTTADKVATAVEAEMNDGRVPWLRPVTALFVSAVFFMPLYLVLVNVFKHGADIVPDPAGIVTSLLES